MFDFTKHLTPSIRIEPKIRVVFSVFLLSTFILGSNYVEARKGALGRAINRTVINGVRANDRTPLAQLNYAELLNCLKHQDAIAAEEGSLTPHELAIEASTAKLGDFENRLTNVESKINQLDANGLQSQEDVDAYNFQVDRFNQLLISYKELSKEHRSSIEKFNSDVALFNNQLSAWNASCANKSYYQDDFDKAMESL